MLHKSELALVTRDTTELCNKPVSSSTSSDSGIVMAESSLELDNGSPSFHHKTKDKNTNGILYTPSPLSIKKENPPPAPQPSIEIKIEDLPDDQNDRKSTKSDCSSSIVSSCNDSENISIHSRKPNDDDSDSIVESDSDDEFGKGYIVKKLGEHISQNPEENVRVVGQQISGAPNGVDYSAKLNIDKVSIGGNTSDVTFGNKFIFPGNVLVKQFVVQKYNNDRNKQNGKDNFAYEDGDNNLTTDAVSAREAKSSSDNNKTSQTFYDGISKKIKSHSKVSIVLGVIIVVLIISSILIAKWGLSKSDDDDSNIIGDGDDSRKNIPINSSIGDDIISPGRVLRMISRDEWIAQPPNEDLTDLILPAHRVIIAHTATEPCVTQAQCTFRVRFIQTFHIESRNFADIAYNFLVGGDGAVYEGRGWDKQGAHTKGYNVGSICVAFIGTFITKEPSAGQLNAAQLIIEEGVKLKKLLPDYKLYGHRQLIATESPGEALYKIIQTWPNFSKELEAIPH